MKLFQYWDAPEPPDEVAGWIEGFRRDNPGLSHRLYDRDSASWFLRKHLGERHQRAFDAIAVPAMQADYFRLGAIWARGGLYLDADFQSLKPLGGLLAQAPRSMMLSWDGHIVAGLMMFRRPRDPFVRACLDLSTEVIEARAMTSAYTAAGAGVFNAIRILIDPSSQEEVTRGFDNFFGRGWRFPQLMERARRSVVVTPEVAEAFHAMTVLHLKRLNGWIGREAPAYKQTRRHWLHWRGSIYVDRGAESAEQQGLTRV